VLRRAWPHLTNEIVDRAGEMHSRINENSSPAQWVQSNIDFHGCVFNLAPSPRMLDILNGLIAPWAMYASASLRTDSYNQIRAAEGHEVILKALQNRDLEAGISANIAHLNIAYQTLASALSVSHR
jgi:DNA-binding GntR family transcriptional regulator